MLAWTGYVRDAETKAPLFGLGTIRNIPGIEDHLEHVSGYGYPSRYSGTAGALADWVRTLESRQFHPTILRTPVDEEHPNGHRVAEPDEARDRVLAQAEALDPERHIVLDLWDQS